MSRIWISDRAFDPWMEIGQYQQSRPELAAQAGATAVFVGTMRDLNEGDEVQAMELEHYPGMTEKHLQRICAEAVQRWGLLDALVIHRIGVMQPGDPIVLVATWSAHRRAALDACSFIIEDLKHRAPFWKKESLPEGQRWVEKNTPG